MGAVVIGGVVITVMLLAPKPPIPSRIKQQVVSTLFIPTGHNFVVDRESVKYDIQLKLLTYNVLESGTQVVVSEQATPDSFTDVPQAYQKVLDGMNDYLDFDVNVGSAHLTRPSQLGGKQTAVLNAKGTLLFAKPAADLPDDQWRQFFKAMEVVK